MYFHEVPRDREPESQPAMLSSRRAIGLSKSLKDVRQELPTDAAACIGHTHLNCGTSPSDLHTNTPTPDSKLHRIRQQIPNHLLEPVCIARNHQRRRVEKLLDLDSLRVSRRPHYVDRILHDRHNFQRVQIEIKISGDDTRHVENVVDDLRLRFGIAPDHFDSLLGYRIVERPTFEQSRPAEYRGERCAQLVRNRREKLVLQTVRLFRRLSRAAFQFEQSHILDRHGSQIRGHAHRRDVFRLVNILLVALHFDRADDATHHRHRHRHRRIRTQPIIWTNYNTTLL